MTDNNLLFVTEGHFITEERNAAPEVLMDKFLIFFSDGLMFGVDVAYVVEIITSHSITRLPMVPNYVRGIINLRGQIIPIIDIRLRLGKAAGESDCIVVIKVEGIHLGILVDMVDQMVDVPQGGVRSMPAQNEQEFISGMCPLTGGSTMLLLDCPRLLRE